MSLKLKLIIGNSDTCRCSRIYCCTANLSHQNSNRTEEVASSSRELSAIAKTLQTM